MNARWISFLTVMTTVLGLASFYVGHRLISRSNWAAHHRGVIWLSMVLFVSLQLLGPYLYRVFPNQPSRLFIVQWVGYSTLGIFACIFFYTLSADLLLGSWSLLVRPSPGVDLERRSFLAVIGLTLGSAIIGIAQAIRGPRVFEVEIPLTGLPIEFDGFRIVQITDLHIGPTIRRAYCEKVVSLTNNLSPDLIALTGDFVDGTVEQLRDSIAPLGQLRAKHGRFFITGNHEYYWGVDSWIEEHRRLGAQVLLNENVVITKGKGQLIIAGVTDIGAGHAHPGHTSDPKKALLGAPSDAIRILLAHQPSSYQAASDAGFSLQLSGHTHGGQFFPWSLLVGLAHRYYKGLYRHEKMWVYVSRGTGYWGPPLRFGVPSELTLIRLKSV